VLLVLAGVVVGLAVWLPGVVRRWRTRTRVLERAERFGMDLDAVRAEYRYGRSILWPVAAPRVPRDPLGTAHLVRLEPTPGSPGLELATAAPPTTVEENCLNVLIGPRMLLGVTRVGRIGAPCACDEHTPGCRGAVLAARAAAVNAGEHPPQGWEPAGTASEVPVADGSGWKVVRDAGPTMRNVDVFVDHGGWAFIVGVTTSPERSEVAVRALGGVLTSMRWLPEAA